MHVNVLAQKQASKVYCTLTMNLFLTKAILAAALSTLSPRKFFLQGFVSTTRPYDTQTDNQNLEKEKHNP